MYQKTTRADCPSNGCCRPPDDFFPNLTADCLLKTSPISQNPATSGIMIVPATGVFGKQDLSPSVIPTMTQGEIFGYTILPHPGQRSHPFLPAGQSFSPQQPAVNVCPVPTKQLHRCHPCKRSFMRDGTPEFSGVDPLESGTFHPIDVQCCKPALIVQPEQIPGYCRFYRKIPIFGKDRLPSSSSRASIRSPSVTKTVSFPLGL